MDVTVYKLFVYGTLMHRRTFVNLISSTNTDYSIISIEPAFIYGKMYNKSNMFPIVVEPDAVKKAKFPITVYGALITVESDHSLFMGLDLYEGCSMYAHGDNYPMDLYHRKTTVATPIRFKHMSNFINHEFVPLEPVQAWVYFGNPHQQEINHIVKKQRRIDFWRTLFTIEDWPEYKND